MKKVKILIVFSAFAVLLSCSKEQKGVNVNSDSLDPEMSIAAGGDIDVVVTCNGSCDGGSSCSIKKDMIEKQYFCSCQSDACSMLVEVLGIENGVVLPSVIIVESEANDYINELTEGMELFMDDLDVHINEVHNESSFKVTQTGIGRRENDHYVKYEYTTELGIEESVLFIYETLGTKKYKVECNGGCNANDTALCTEKFGFGSGEIGCACQSDACSMTLTELPTE